MGLVTLTEAELNTVEPPTYVLDGWVPEKSHVFVYSQPNAGKSLLLIDWAQHIVRGAEWHERESVALPTLYLTAEGTSAFRGRVEAWRKHNGYPVADVQDGMYYHFDRLTLAGDPTNKDEFKPSQAQVEESLIDLGVKLLIVDPLANYVGGDLSKGDVANTYLNWVADLNREGITVITSHHVSKAMAQSGSRAYGGLGLRNASELAGAADQTYELKPKFKGESGRDDEGLEYVDLWPTKVKDGGWPTSMSFELAEYTVPGAIRLLDGSLGTSVALAYKGPPSKSRVKSRLEAIEAVIAATPGLTKSDVRKIVTGDTGVIGTDIDMLVDIGRLNKDGHKLYIAEPDEPDEPDEPEVAVYPEAL